MVCTEFTLQPGWAAVLALLCSEMAVFMGGDSSMYHVGDYTLNKNHFTADVRTDCHTSNLPSVLGVDKAHITLNGTCSNESVEAEGSSRRVFSHKPAVSARLSWSTRGRHFS